MWNFTLNIQNKKNANPITIEPPAKLKGLFTNPKDVNIGLGTNYVPIGILKKFKPETL